MNIKIKNILLKLINEGYEAYVVGGFVRDYLLGIESYDVDIATNARPMDVKRIYNLSNSNDDSYGSIDFKDSIYNYDITTYRREKKYENRKPVEFEYINDIKDDILRRDFTINSLYMDVDGNIYDLVNGRDDLESGLIKSIGNITDKMSEDPLRILRAIRFASILDFEIDATLYNFIRQNKQLVRTLSYNRKKMELDKIFNSEHKLKGIELLRGLGLDKELDLDMPSIIKDSGSRYGIWAQIDYSNKYPFSNDEKDIIDGIKKILNYGTIDNIVLYESGLYNSMVAGDILGIPRMEISNLYKELPIYSNKDIKITGDDIIKILNIEPGEKIKKILIDIEINILNNNVTNEYESLKEYVLSNWK